MGRHGEAGNGDGAGRLRPYVVTLLAVVAIFALRLLLAPVVGPFQPYALFYVVVLVTAWTAGAGPAIVAAVLGFAAGTYLSAGAPGGHPLLRPGPAATFAALYALVSGALIAFTTGLRRREASARADTATAHAMRRTLEEELVRRTAAERALGRQMEQLERLRAETRDSEERLRLMLESARDYAILWIDTDGTIASWSEGARRVFGYTADEAIGRDAAMVFTPEDRAARVPEREMETAVRTGCADDERWHQRKDGGRVFVSGSLRPIRDADGGLRGFSKVAQDVTHRLRAAEERETLLRDAEQARAEAEAANRAKDDFLAILSHELRAPLQATVGWLHLLRHAPDETTRARAVDTIERNVRAQARVIDDLLDVSRIVAGKLTLEQARVDLTPLVASCIESARPAAAAKGVQLTASSPEGPCEVRGDTKRLGQVLDNLLANAIKFTPAGGRVDVGVRAERSLAEIRVSDTGHGIEPAMLAAIFEPFRQADRSTGRQHGGLGLGLAIVRYLIEQHGGTVEAESAGPGRGATFFVRLPRLLETAPARSPAARPAASGRSLEDVDVLVVEDDPDTREGLALVLQSAGARVTQAASVDEALDAFRRSPAAIVVSDVAMPGRSGYELVRELRRLENETGRRTRVVAMTGFAGRDDRLRALDAGFDEHLPKPVLPDELVARITALLTDTRSG